MAVVPPDVAPPDAFVRPENVTAQPHTAFSPANSPQQAEPAPKLLESLEALDRQATRADAALKTLARTLVANATNPAFFYQLGLALQDRGRHEAAAEHHERAIQIQPQFEAAYVALASVRREQGRFDEARGTLERFMKLAPGGAALHTELAAILEAQGRYDDAIRRLRLAVEIDPSSAAAWFRLGRLLQQQGETQEAHYAFTQSIAGRTQCQARHPAVRTAVQYPHSQDGPDGQDGRATAGD